MVADDIDGLTKVRPKRQDAPGAAPERLAGGLLAPSTLQGVIGYHLRLAQEASFAAFNQRVGDPDLKPGRYSILTILAANPGATPTALARACGRDKSTLTAALRDLERRGLVLREPVPDDQRSVRIHLTEAGLGLLERLRHHAEAHDRVLDRLVGPENKAAFVATLIRIANSLAEAEEAGSEAAVGPDGER